MRINYNKLKNAAIKGHYGFMAQESPLKVAGIW